MSVISEAMIRMAIIHNWNCLPFAAKGIENARINMNVSSSISPVAFGALFHEALCIND